MPYFLAAGPQRGAAPQSMMDDEDEGPPMEDEFMNEEDELEAQWVSVCTVQQKVHTHAIARGNLKTAREQSAFLVCVLA